MFENDNKVKRVAAYCRVSTDKTDQANSLESQQQFFNEYIRRNHLWELYDIYVDDGISGTNTKKRVAFNQMIEDAKSGKFDLIITKEISRFARNILDSIGYTRELKALGIGVIFLNDNMRKCALHFYPQWRRKIAERQVSVLSGDCGGRWKRVLCSAEICSAMMCVTAS